MPIVITKDDVLGPILFAADRVHRLNETPTQLGAPAMIGECREERNVRGCLDQVGKMKEFRFLGLAKGLWSEIKITPHPEQGPSLDQTAQLHPGRGRG